MRRNLHGSVVAVIGGARGIGYATARQFSHAGANVVLGDIDATAASANSAPIGATGMSIDVRDPDACARFFEDVQSQLGPVDVLINSAGVAVPGGFLAGTAEEHQLQVDVNLDGVIRTMSLVLPGMLNRRRGHVINIASAAGRVAAPNAAVYSATKHAVVALTEAVRWEMVESGVHLTAILPTVVDTEMAAGLLTRGLPKVSAEAVASAAIAAAQSNRPAALISVPRWFGAVGALDLLSPQWLRDRVRGVLRVDTSTETEERRAYSARVRQQITQARAEVDPS